MTKQQALAEFANETIENIEEALTHLMGIDPVPKQLIGIFEALADLYEAKQNDI